MRLFCMPSDVKRKSEQAYRLLGKCVDKVYGIDPGPVARTPFGKPYFPESPHIYFSLSHTDTFVMCVLSPSPVGGDVQLRKTVSPALPARVCAEKELEEFEFFDLWSLKESYIKLYGKKEKDYREICFYRDGDNVLSRDEKVFCKIYDGVPGCSCAVCSFDGDLPREVEFVSPDFEFPPRT